VVVNQLLSVSKDKHSEFSTMSTMQHFTEFVKAFCDFGSEMLSTVRIATGKTSYQCFFPNIPWESSSLEAHGWYFFLWFTRSGVNPRVGGIEFRLQTVWPPWLPCANTDCVVLFVSDTYKQQIYWAFIGVAIAEWSWHQAGNWRF